MAKREVWIEEEEGRTTGPWFNKALAMRHVRNGRRVTRYVPDEPAAEGWEAWAIVQRSSGGICAIAVNDQSLPVLMPGCDVVKVRVVPVEVKARKRKGGAK